jgi:hypothetical protein
VWTRLIQRVVEVRFCAAIGISRTLACDVSSGLFGFHC